MIEVGAGWAMEPRKVVRVQGADGVVMFGRQHGAVRQTQELRRPCEVGEPVHALKSLTRELGGPAIGLAKMAARSALGTLRGHASDGRLRGVGQAHSS